VARTGNLTCTDWARTTVNAADRRAAAVTGLMMSYQPATGLFARTGWWNSANALTAVIEYARLTGSTSYRYAIENTWLRQRHAALGEFRNEYVDDTGWWGLAWIAAYDLTKDPRYLATARADAEFMHAYWDGHCGGGVWWKTTGIVKNAITNSLYIQLNAALAGRVPDAGPYRSRALAGWAWFQATGLVNDEYLVNDGVSSKTCRNAGNTHWTYNSGVLIAALVELSRLTGDGHALTVARRVAVAMTTSLRFNRFGVFREQCEPGCRSDPDKASFKGAAVRGLSALNRATNAAFDPWLRKQADLTYRANRNRLDMYSFHWDGPFDWSDVSAQHSVVDLFNASP
jgi:predicted alpha-1,6-mannanase (GH76 family)